MDSWVLDMTKAYLIDKGISYEKTEEQVRKFLPNRIDTPRHHLMHIMEGEETIGYI